MYMYKALVPHVPTQGPVCKHTCTWFLCPWQPVLVCPVGAHCVRRATVALYMHALIRYE